MACSSTVSHAATSNDRIAALTIINYDKLSKHDPEQSALLLSACAEAGFCYLDLENWNGSSYLKDVDTLFDVGKQYFAQPLEVKKKDTNQDISLFNICGQGFSSTCYKMQ
jgi:isopenicillin N synthase-like dioxygenase